MERGRNFTTGGAEKWPTMCRRNGWANSKIINVILREVQVSTQQLQQPLLRVPRRHPLYSSLAKQKKYIWFWHSPPFLGFKFSERSSFWDIHIIPYPHHLSSRNIIIYLCSGILPRVNYLVQPLLLISALLHRIAIFLVCCVILRMFLFCFVSYTLYLLLFINIIIIVLWIVDK